MKTVRWKNTNAAYHVMGEGPLVMLLHGFAENSTVWQHQASHLAEENKIVLPELPGNGFSGEAGEDLSLEDCAELIFEISRSETKGTEAPFTLIGHSMGGYISLAFANKYPSFLNGIGLFHSTAFADTEEKIANRKIAIDFISKNSKSPYLKTSVPNLFSQHSKTIFPQNPDQVVEMGMEYSDEALKLYQEAMLQRRDRSDFLKTTDLPVLLVQGKFDEAVPLASGLAQASMPATCHFHVLKQTAHMGMLEEKEQSTQVLKSYIDWVNKYGEKA